MRFMKTSLRESNPGRGSRRGRTGSHPVGGLSTSRRPRGPVKRPRETVQRAWTIGSATTQA